MSSEQRAGELLAAVTRLSRLARADGPRRPGGRRVFEDPAGQAIAADGHASLGDLLAGPPPAGRAVAALFDSPKELALAEALRRAQEAINGCGAEGTHLRSVFVELLGCTRWQWEAGSLGSEFDIDPLESGGYGRPVPATASRYDPPVALLDELDGAARDAAAAIRAAGRTAPAPQPAPPPGARHSEDFHSVLWFGTVYEFTNAQAACVRELWAAWENGTGSVGANTIIDAAGLQSKRLRDVFKDHPAWDRMIVKATKRGSYRLDPGSGRS